MSSTIVPVADVSERARPKGLVDRLARSLVLRQLAKIADGELVVDEDGRQWRFGAPSSRLPRTVAVVVRVLQPGTTSRYLLRN